MGVPPTDKMHAWGTTFTGIDTRATDAGGAGDAGANPPGSVDASGTVTIPEVTIVGDPVSGKAYNAGYKDGQAGLPTGRKQYEQIPVDPKYLQDYDEGFADGQNASGVKPAGDTPEPPPYDGPAIGPIPHGEGPEGESEGPEKPDEEAENKSLELGRYMFLRMQIAKMRQVRGMGLHNSEFEISEAEREEYERLFGKFGMDDPEAELPPSEAEMVFGEGEGEGEAEGE